MKRRRGRRRIKLLLFLNQYFERQTPISIGLFAMAFALLISAIDIGLRIELFVLYIFPIYFAAWFGGRRVGDLLAVYAPAAVFLNQIWNLPMGMTRVDVTVSMLIRLAVYLVFSYVVAKLRSSTRMQRQMTEFIVHDLRSPVSSAITGLQTLQEMHPMEDPIERELVDMAIVSNNRALDLVNSLLDVAKLESGKMPVQLEVTDLEPMIQASIDHVALWAQTNQVQIQVQIGAERAYIDPRLTSRVLANLLSNALKYSPAEGAVRIRTEVVGNMVRFSVQDQGPGIPPEYHRSIFGAFEQVKGTKGGSGLGLTFCKLAVEAQGGKIWLESTLGRGTRMYFTLPLATPADEMTGPIQLVQ